MKENPNIDELLNSFIDGEMTQRQQIEVQRLISHNARVAQRLRELQKCKMLVGSLPRAEAPPDMAERVKESLERRAPLERQPSYFEVRKGARRLLLRKVLTAAAMIGLVAVLTVLVYTIMVPESAIKKPIANGSPGPAPSIVAAEFYGRLVLKTGDFVRVDASVNRAIEDNGLLDYISPTPRSLGEKGEYALGCSREALSLLLADLGNIWQKLGSATLFVETNQFGEQIVVNAVNAKQIAEIVKQDSLKERIEVAKNFALLNNMAELLPGKELFAAINGESPGLIASPPPRLTSHKAIKKLPSQIEDSQKVHLAIVVVGSE
jgi:hypothetical protein